MILNTNLGFAVLLARALTGTDWYLGGGLLQVANLPERQRRTTRGGTNQVSTSDCREMSNDSPCTSDIVSIEVL